MATLAVQVSTQTGVAITANAAAAGGDQFLNNGKVGLWIENSHATDPRTITIVTQKTIDALAVTDRTMTITAGEDRKWIGPFDKSIYNDSSNYVQLTYSDSAADITVSPIQLMEI